MPGPTIAEILMLVAVPALLVLSGFCSGSETAWFSLSQHQRLQLRRQGTVVSTLIAQLADEKRVLLVTLMLGNMIANVSYFVVTTLLLISIDQRALFVGWVITALHIAPLLSLILLGEVLPKFIASGHVILWSRICAVPLMIIHRALGPVRLICIPAVIKPLARLIAPPRRPPELSPKELQRLLDLSQQRGVINPDEQQILQQVLTLSRLKVRELMTPRVDIVAFDLNDDAGELMRLVTQTKLSRVIVYRDDLDHIEGMVYRRQVLLGRPQTAAQVQALIRRVRFVPEQQRADHLLVELRKRGTTLAIVVDEYGGTAGLVTLEDTVEHLVGEIVGPHHDGAMPAVQALDDHSWRVSADLSIHEWQSTFGQLADVGGVSTVGGLVMAHLGRAPHNGDAVSLGNLSIKVETMDGRRIDSLLMQLDPAGGAAGDNVQRTGGVS